MIYDNHEWDWIDEIGENRFVAWVIVVALLLVVLSATSALGADKPMSMIARDQMGSVIALYESPCDVDEVLERVKPEIRKQFQRAMFVYRGKPLAACWAVGPNGMIYVIDAEGDVTTVPPAAFRPDYGS